MPSTSIMERLTYLLGICVAVIAWSFGQLAGTVSSAKILAYDISVIDAEGDKNTSIILENVSKAANPGKVDIIFDVSSENCITAFHQRGLGASMIGDLEPNISPTGAITKVDTMPPGSAYKFTAVHKASCSVHPSLRPSSQDTRIIPSGIESFSVSHQFTIMLLLASVFGTFFIVTYAFSAVIAWRAK